LNCSPALKSNEEVDKYPISFNFTRFASPCQCKRFFRTPAAERNIENFIQFQAEGV
jgi:hypothetical protein